MQMLCVAGEATPEELSDEHPINKRGKRTWVTKAQFDKILAEPTMKSQAYMEGTYVQLRELVHS